MTTDTVAADIQADQLTAKAALELIAPDVGNAFAPEVIDFAARTRESDDAEYVRLEVGLRKMGVPMRQWLRGVQSRKDEIERAAASVEEAAAADALATKAEEEEEISEGYRLAYPILLPETEGDLYVYRKTSSGKVWLHEVKSGKEGICYKQMFSPITAVAYLNFVDEEKAGLRIALENMDGERVEYDIFRSLLSQPQLIKEDLLDRGFRHFGHGLNAAVNGLNAAEPSRKIVTYSKPGWHRVQIEDRQHTIFISPGGQAITAEPIPGISSIDLSNRARMANTTAGSVEGWKEAISVLTRVENVPHWLLGVATTFAGSLVSLTGLSNGISIATCGLAFVGDSSKGKTLTMKVAASGWSSTTVGEGLVQTIKATENSLELLAAKGNATLIAFDEMGLTDAAVIGRLIYMLANGQGKTRMRADQTQAKPLKWRSFALLSGEMSIAEKMKDEGETLHPGMVVRIGSVNVSEVNQAVALADVKALEDGIERNRGQVGPAFIRGLMDLGLHDDPDQVVALINAAALKLADGNGYQVRAAIPFAVLLVATKLAKEMDLVPRDLAIEDAIDWAWAQYSGSTTMDPGKELVANINLWLMGRWGRSVVPIGETVYDTRDGYAYYQDDTVYVPEEFIRNIGGGRCTAKAIDRYLAEQGCINEAKAEKGRRQAVVAGKKVDVITRYLPQVGKQAFAMYPLLRHKLGVQNLEGPTERAARIRREQEGRDASNSNGPRIAA